MKAVVFKRYHTKMTYHLLCPESMLNKVLGQGAVKSHYSFK